MTTREEIVRLAYTPGQIKDKTDLIYRLMLDRSPTVREGNFTHITPEDVEYMFNLYDYYFFNGFFKQNLHERIFFRTTQMIDAAGKTLTHFRSKTYIISLSAALLLQTFSDIKREIVVNGLVCHDRLEAAQRVMEHEITHIIEHELFNTGSDCFRHRYRRLVKKLFGHTGVTHQLVTPRERAGVIYRLKEGDEVTFMYRDRVFRGTIFRIEADEAAVLVPDPSGILLDAQRRRCSRYQVALENLKRPFV